MTSNPGADPGQTQSWDPGQAPSFQQPQPPGYGGPTQPSRIVTCYARSSDRSKLTTSIRGSGTVTPSP